MNVPTELPPLIPDDDNEVPPKDFESYVHWRFHQIANKTHTTSLHMVLQTQILEGQAKCQDNQAKLIERLSIDIAGDGNGKPGLKAELKDIKRWQSDHDSAAETRSAKTAAMVKWVMGIVGSALTGIIVMQMKQVNTLQSNQEMLGRNQETISRQIQQLPGAKQSAPVVIQ